MDDGNCRRSFAVFAWRAKGFRRGIVGFVFTVAEATQCCGDNARYCFGASAVLNDLLRQIEKERVDAYQAAYRFSGAAGGY